MILVLKTIAPYLLFTGLVIWIFKDPGFIFYDTDDMMKEQYNYWFYIKICLIKKESN